MAPKPTIKKLQQKIKSLEREIQKQRKNEAVLKESEEKFKTIFEYANDHIVFMDVDGSVIDVNDKVEDMFGYKREAVIGKKFYEFSSLAQKDWQKCIEIFQNLVEGKTPRTQILELEAKGKDKKTVFIEVNPRIVKKDGRIIGFLSIIRDITKRKQEEKFLRKHRDKLEKLVAERTSEFDELNSALRVLLKKSNEVKKEIEDKILFNLGKFVIPYVEKLKKSRLNPIQHTYLENLEANLDDITSPFVHGMSTKYMKLTLTEIQIANFIKEGKTTKEIAGTLNMSIRTIDTHRFNIRNKIGLRNKMIRIRFLVNDVSAIPEPLLKAHRT